MSKTWNEMHNDFWYIPIMIMPGNNGAYAILTYELDYDDGPVLITYQHYLESYDDTDYWDLSLGGTTYLEDDAFEIQYTSSGANILTNGETIAESVPYTMAFATDGDWVLAENPIVNPSKDIYAFGKTPRITQGNYMYQQCIYGKGNLTAFANMGINRCGAGYDSVNDAYISGYLTESEGFAYTVPTTSQDVGVKLGNAEFAVEWYDHDDYVVLNTQASFDTYIVPKTVTAGGETQNGWLSDDFGSLPSNGIWIYGMKTDSTHADFYADVISGNYADTPFYTHDFSANPLLVIGIGQQWAVYADAMSLEGIQNDRYIRLWIGQWSDSLYTYGLTVLPNGSCSYGNGAEYESPSYSLPNAIGYLSSEGNMKTYYNENAPKSDSLFAWIADVGHNDDEGWQLCAGSYGGFKDPNANGGGVIFDDHIEPVEPYEHTRITIARSGWSEYTVQSIEFATSGNDVTGATVTYSGGGDTVEKTYSLTDQSAPTLEDYTVTGTMMFCVVPSGTEYSDSNGGGIPSSLEAMITAVPIIVIAGLIIAGVGMLRAKV